MALGKTTYLKYYWKHMQKWYATLLRKRIYFQYARRANSVSFDEFHYRLKLSNDEEKTRQIMAESVLLSFDEFFSKFLQIHVEQ